MSFLGVGYQEILLIFVLMLVVVGPERMPGVAYQIGRAVREMQKYARAVRNEFSDEITYIEEQYKVVKGEVDTARQGLRDQQSQFDAEMRAATAPIGEAQAALKEALPSNVVSINGASTPAALPAPAPEPAATPAETPANPPAPPLVF